MRALAVAFGAVALAGGVACAASPLEAMQACSAMKDDTARLACYDKAMAVPRPVQAAVAAPAAATPSASAADEFGMTEELRRKRNPEAKSEGLAELRAKVVSVKVRQSEALLVELDNGQAWLEIEHRRAMVVGAGESVTVKPGVLGSYFLVLDSGVSSRVRRVR